MASHSVYMAGSAVRSTFLVRPIQKSRVCRRVALVPDLRERNELRSLHGGQLAVHFSHGVVFPNYNKRGGPHCREESRADQQAARKARRHRTQKLDPTRHRAAEFELPAML